MEFACLVCKEVLDKSYYLANIMVTPKPNQLSTKPTTSGALMGCTTTYQEFRKVDQQARQIDKFISELGVIKNRLWLEYYSFLLFLKAKGLFRATDNAFRCYDIETADCRECLANVDKEFRFLRKAFEKMFSPLQRTTGFAPLARWFYNWATENLEDRLENIDLISDSQIALGLRNYISHVTSTKAAPTPNLHEKPNGL